MTTPKLSTILAALFVAVSAQLTHADDAQSLSLAGEWRFQLDPSDVGVTERWEEKGLTDRIFLPGSLQERGFGEDVSTNTVWTGSLNERSWFTAERYAPYRKPGNVKVPFWLQPDKRYIGVAWYHREVKIPTSWSGKRLVARFERAHWGTTLWLDGRKIGARDGLGTPHEYDLGAAVQPGIHTLTLRVDNRELVAVGADAHSISDHTQGNWNGVAGRLEIVATDPVWFEDVRVFPDAAARRARLAVKLGNATGKQGNGLLTLSVRSYNGPRAASPKRIQVPIRWDTAGGQLEFAFDLGADAPLWDEFNPALHELTLQIQGTTAPHTVTFGLRDVSVQDKQLTVNGRKIFLRGTLECCIFPEHGYPPTDIASWKRVLNVARAHGLNHLRFHSWCPPEAAFVAADEMGFYFQVECSAWTSQFNKGTPLDKWIYDESERIVAANGNHPSFLLLVASNEPGGSSYEKFLGQFVNYWKQKDNRRLYSAGSGWPSIAENDYDVTADSRAYPVHSAANGRNETDYSAFLARRARPVVSHEIGQYCVFPNLDEIPKYRGLLKAKNFEIVSDFLAQAGLRNQAKDFLKASGKLQALFYKEEIEACLRTTGWSGFQLLDLHDFPGQGTALVGVLDAFWDEKGYIKPAEYRRFCDETVPLARFAKRIWTADETLRATVDVAHYGARDLPNAAVAWKLLRGDGKRLAAGQFAARTLPTGRVTGVGKVEIPLPELTGLTTATALKLEVEIPGTRFGNGWHLWVFPGSASDAPPSNVSLVKELDSAALETLDQGGRVVLLADPRRVAGGTVGRFDPIFWNKLWFPSQPQHTLGLLLNPAHPALAQFPTDSHADWQWQDLQNHSKPMVLDGLPKGLRPLVQVIDDWNTCRKLGLVFEARVGKGRLLVTSLDLESNLAERPAARQLRSSLLAYAASNRFKPDTTVTPEQVKSLFRDLVAMEKLGARIHSADSQQDGYAAGNAIDGDPGTMWHTPWGDNAPEFPHEISIALQATTTISGIAVLPRQDANRNGWIRGYEIYTSLDGKGWGNAVAHGEFPANDTLKEIKFEKPVQARFIKLKALSSHSKGPFVSLAEIEVLLPGTK